MDILYIDVEKTGYVHFLGKISAMARFARRNPKMPATTAQLPIIFSFWLGTWVDSDTLSSENTHSQFPEYPRERNNFRTRAATGQP